MDFKHYCDNIFLRLDPGELIVEGIKTTCTKLGIKEAAIVSGVGMLKEAELGFFDIPKNDYDRKKFQGIYDLSVVCGNVTEFDGVIWPHVHMVFNSKNYNTISGHVIEAKCHITTELFLTTTNVGIYRDRVAGCPASRILFKNDDLKD